MQVADAIHRSAATDGQIGHIKSLRRIVCVLAAQGQQVVDGNAKLFLCVPPQVLLDESRSEAVKAGGHRRVGREKIPRSRDGQSNFKGLSGLLHETAGAFQHGKGRVPFIQMTDFRLDAQRNKQSPAADPEQQLLLQSQLRTTAVQLARNPTMRGEVCGVVAVQQVQLDSADLNLPARSQTE